MIAILLATYNSSDYIRELLDSLFQQTNQDWTLVVRDDGSIDNTLSIVDEYTRQHEGRVVVINDNNKGLRAYLNFVELLKRTDAQYYMFCDHDDVWLPDKVQLSYDRMIELEKQNPDKPIIVHTDMKVVDENLNIICDSFWKYSNLLPDHTSFEEMVHCNSANGCAMMFNQKAKEVALMNIGNATMHDILLNQSVAGNDGVISAIKSPQVLYRQHIDNVVGAHKRDFTFYLKKLTDIPFLIKDNYDSRQRANKIHELSFFRYLYTKVKVSYYKITVKYDVYE